MPRLDVKRQDGLPLGKDAGQRDSRNSTGRADIVGQGPAAEDGKRRGVPRTVAGLMPR